MKIKDNFLLHTLGEEHVVVPVEDSALTFRGMIRLNGTGTFLWKKMEEDVAREDLIQAVLEQYEVSEEKAAEAVEEFIARLTDAELIEE